MVVKVINTHEGKNFFLDEGPNFFKFLVFQSLEDMVQEGKGAGVKTFLPKAFGDTGLARNIKSIGLHRADCAEKPYRSCGNAREFFVRLVPHTQHFKALSHNGSQVGTFEENLSQPNVLSNHHEALHNGLPTQGGTLIGLVQTEQARNIDIADEVDELARVRYDFKGLASHLNLVVIEEHPII